jgi:transcriptional regulator with PAS, ATPase and Fis domain
MKARSKMNAKPNKAAVGKMAAAIEALKRRMALEALKRHGNLEKAGKELGITPDGLRNMLHRYGIRVRVKVTRTIEIHGPKQ